MEHARSLNAGETRNLQNQTADNYVDGMLREETRATVAQIKVANELGTNTVLQTEYNDAYKKAFDDTIAQQKGEDEARRVAEVAGPARVYEGFQNGEIVTSVNG